MRRHHFPAECILGQLLHSWEMPLGDTRLFTSGTSLRQGGDKKQAGHLTIFDISPLKRIIFFPFIKVDRCRAVDLAVDLAVDRDVDRVSLSHVTSIKKNNYILSVHILPILYDIVVWIFGKVYTISFNEPSLSVSASVLPHFKGVGELCNLFHGRRREICGNGRGCSRTSMPRGRLPNAPLP